MSQMDTHTFDDQCAAVGVRDADATTQQVYVDLSEQDADQEVCLVQIYPPDVVDGMMLLDQARIVIGRDEESDLILDDTSVSREHATISVGANGYYVEDLKSTNGTRVNGELVDRVLLESGDRIQLGSFIFKYLSGNCVETQYHETIYTSMTRDALTGAMNKRYLMEATQREIARSIRQKHPLCVVMMDIDFFKSVNDTHGHLVGDEVLREFGSRLLGVCREENLLARYGGEEFSLLMPSASKEEAIELAERCRQEIAGKPFKTAAGPLEITASFGVGCLPENVDAFSVSEIFKIADDRLYDAKEQGRNRVIA